MLAGMSWSQAAPQAGSFGPGERPLCGEHVLLAGRDMGLREAGGPEGFRPGLEMAGAGGVLGRGPHKGLWRHSQPFLPW